MASVYLLVTTVLWGLWGFAEKQASLRASPWVVQWMYSLPYVAVFGAGLVGRAFGADVPVSGPALGWSFVGGVSAIAASVFLLFAMKVHAASTAVALTSAYPLVTLLLGVATRTETVRPAHLAGLGLVAAGAFLLNAAG